ncbi:PAS domain-containing protein [Novosphingobium sp. P6W]|uniref:PAS domain-containing protein n=1 Tax=Novosphingobium sp. P6W TaxID=1609758 RepID=UPI0009E61DC3|nr:PAS domain-containing protein [Novosphingobium sp. P6W]AXB79053.1 response regulator [Novosphingobium sp. P6W]
MPTSPSPRLISLPPELIAYVEKRIKSGDYGSSDEIISAAFDLLRGQDNALAGVSEGWPHGGGECGRLIGERDWTATVLGHSASWPTELRATVANIVNSPVAKVLMWGAEHVMLYNDGYRAIAGDRHPLALGTPVAKAFPEVWEWNRPILEAGMRGEIVAHRDQPIQFHRPDGPETMILDLFYTPVYKTDGQVGGVMCTIVDNSGRVDAERRLAESEAELRRITDALPLLVSYVDRDHVYRFANACYEDWFGPHPDTIIGKPVAAVVGEAVYEDRRPSIARALAGESFSTEAILPRKDGQNRRCELRYIPHIDDAGVVHGVHVLAIDIEERAQREAALVVSNGRFRAAMDAVHGVLWTNSPDGRMIGEQAGWAELTGQSIDEYQNFGWADAVHPDDTAATIEAWNAAVSARSMFVFEHRVRRHCGTWRTFAIRALPLLDDAGQVIEWVGVHTDITHQRAAEATLREQADNLAREARHRRRAEEQLQLLNEDLEARVITEIDERRKAEAKLTQAQKMETVGKLTGGVAHDFNNLLQVVSGNLQLLMKDIAGNDRAERRVANAMAGVSRGAKLASQLLAFGRRQALEPKVVNVTRIIRGMDDMLRRAIGEAVEIETVVGGGLWNTFIDPAQIENALLNLAINARDAMEGQGKLTIEVGNAHLDDHYAATHDEVVAGQYVMLAVSDTGSGMTAEIREKVFEPFFSTKGEGKGSGLGLSMVYGFVKQSGGHVKIYSELGEGTTVKLYLPRAMQAEDFEVIVDSGPITGGTETVLVVEDDAEVRATVVETLTDLGYSVLKAVDAASALNVIESGVPIDILFTDVVMPGTLKSPELARKARERLPNIAVLFTSGYTENSIVHGGKLDAGVELLSKPYTREALARRFRHVLANQKQRGLTDHGAASAAGTDSTAAQPTAASITVLLVEDDDLIRMNTADMLQAAGFVVVDAGNAEDAMTALQTVRVDCLVTDVNLPGLSGPEFAAKARSLREGIAIVFATGDASVEHDLPGAIILTKPYGMAALSAAVSAAVGNVGPEEISDKSATVSGSHATSRPDQA